MLTLAPHRSWGRRILGAILLTGTAGALAVASIGVLRGAHSVHPRPESTVVGAEAVGSGITPELTAYPARLDGTGTAP